MPTSDAHTKLTAERAQALELLLDAQAKLGIVQPESLRPSILHYLRATHDLVHAHRSLLGLPINPALDMARQIVTEWDRATPATSQRADLRERRNP